MRHDKLTDDLDILDSDISGAREDTNGWTVPWADLMMVMFVLFVVLFIYSQSKENIKVIFSGNAESGVSSNPVDSLIDSISMHRAGMSANSKIELPPQKSLFRSSGGSVSVNTEDNGEVKIIMRGDTFFRPGKASLGSLSKSYLSEIAGMLTTNNHAIHVVGHSDDSDATVVGGVGAFELSARRAARAAQYLIKSSGIDPRRIMISGRGITRPEVPSSVEKVSGNNRRVEIYILNTVLNDSKGGR